MHQKWWDGKVYPIWQDHDESWILIFIIYTFTCSYTFVQNDDFLPVWQLTPKRPRARQSGIRTISFSCKRVSWRKWISIESLKVPPDSKPMVQHTSSLIKIKDNPIHTFSKRIIYITHCSLYVIEQTVGKYASPICPLRPAGPSDFHMVAVEANEPQAPTRFKTPTQNPLVFWHGHALSICCRML